MSKLATMTSAGGLSWDLTTDDALWMARSVVGESTRDTVEVVSTMLRRLAWVSDQRGRHVWPSLAVLLHGDRDGDGAFDTGEAGYSQPIAVQWMTRGDADRQARRARMRSLAWTDIPANVRALVLELLTGQRALALPGAVHFADTPTTRDFLARTPGARLVHTSSTGAMFVAMAGSVGYQDPRIMPAPGAVGPAGANGNGSLLGLVAVALAIAVELA